MDDSNVVVAATVLGVCYKDRRGDRSFFFSPSWVGVGGIKKGFVARSFGTYKAQIGVGWYSPRNGRLQKEGRMKISRD